MRKIKSASCLAVLIKSLKKKGKKIVFTNGCFDMLHPGHLKTLREAKRKGDILIVGINSDSSVRKIKGKTRPVFDQNFRATMLEAIDAVDYITVFKEETPYEIIKTIKPDILVKGGDWSISGIIGKDIVKKIYRIKAYPGYSTTALIKRIKKNG